MIYVVNLARHERYLVSHGGTGTLRLVDLAALLFDELISHQQSWSSKISLEKDCSYHRYMNMPSYAVCILSHDVRHLVSLTGVGR